MPFVENPAHLSKSRLRSDLVAHNVPLPPAASKKEALVKLHEKHIDQRRAADFSSDEEEEEEDRHVDGAEAREPIDLRCLTDDELRATLLKYGFKAGPIVASTRTLYEKNLRNLLLSDGYELLNEENITVTYSDSEEEGEEEEKEGNGDQEDEESGFYFRTVLSFVTCRKPIKGAARRPVQYAYPDSPVSPATFERREVERRLVPMHIRILVFFFLVFILYIIYVNVCLGANLKYSLTKCKDISRSVRIKCIFVG
uniref:Zgc:92287 n=1 Tax=Salarias fasciatus TaxID=181472 RepID=A0A672JCC1_SALFA